MRDSRNNYLLVGVFVLTMLSALLVWLAVLSGTTQSTTAYYMEFENVIGLSPGGQILFEGYPVGEIDDIVFTRRPDASVYRLNVNIRKDWDIPEDSLAVMTQASLLSAVVVDIQAGSSNQMLAPDSRITSLGSSNIMTAMSSVAAKLGNLADTNLQPLLENLSGGTGSLQTLSKDAPIILDNVKIFTKQLTTASTRLNHILNQSGGHIESILGKADQASGNISTLTTDFHQTRKQLDALLISMRKLLNNNRGEINHSVADLHHALEVVASHVQEISSNLEATTRNMNELSNELRRNPGLLVRDREFSDP
jgi:phospholipid/cholesterol/gamma-HCH transport system substrate-binding protein